VSGVNWVENLLSQVYLDPSGSNCVCRGESGANFDPELFVSGPYCVARARVQTKELILLPHRSSLLHT